MQRRPLDVRSKREFDQGHVPGAVHVPFWATPFASLPVARDTPLSVYCGHGPRAWFAVAVLRARGYGQARLLAGHMRAWKQAGHPLE